MSFYLKHAKYQGVDSVSIFRQNPLWAEFTEAVHHHQRFTDRNNLYELILEVHMYGLNISTEPN
jgi:hypothetical protein